MEGVTNYIDSGYPVSVIYLDFQKSLRQSTTYTVSQKNFPPFNSL